MKKQKKTKSPPQQTSIAEFTFLNDYILVKALKSEGVAGLVKPDQYDDKPELGVVVACGSGRVLDNGSVVPLGFRVGDTIFFGKYSSMQTRSLGEDYFIIRSEDVMAVHNA